MLVAEPKQIILKKGKFDLYVSPRTLKLLHPEYAALDMYRSEGWDGVVTFQISLILFLDYLGIDFIFLPQERATGKLSERIARIREITTDEVLDRYADINCTEFNMPSYCMSNEMQKLTGYYHSTKLLVALSENVDREFFVELALHLSKFEQNNLPALCYPVPELLLFKDQQIQLVKINSTIRDERKEAEFANVYDNVYAPLGIPVNNAEVRPDRVAGAIAEITESSVCLTQHIPMNAKKGRWTRWKSPLTGDVSLVEGAVLDWYRLRGWTGAFSSDAIEELLLSIRRDEDDEMVRLPFQRRVEGYFDGYELWMKDFCDDIAKLNADKLLENYRARPKRQVVDANVSEDLVVALFLKLGSEGIIHIAYNYRHDGWPDLVLLKGSDLVFAEVKTKNDKFQMNQEEVFFNIIRDLPAEYRIVRVEAEC